MVVYSDCYPSLILYEGQKMNGYRVDVKQTDQMIEDWVGMKLADWMENHPRPHSDEDLWIREIDLVYTQIWQSFREQFNETPTDFLIWSQCDA